MRLRNLFRPVYLVRRTGYWVHQKLHPDEPWLAQGAVRFLDANLHPDFIGFEWGSGKSTLWFASRVRRLTSIEHDEKWHSEVAGKIGGHEKKNVNLRLIPLEHEYSDLFSPYYDPLPAYVRAIDEFPDGHFDFILVDGYYRQPCVQRALPKLKPGGLVVIDNTDWLPREQWPVPLDWPLAHQSRNVLTQTSIWRKPNL